MEQNTPKTLCTDQNNDVLKEVTKGKKKKAKDHVKRLRIAVCLLTAWIVILTLLLAALSAFVFADELTYRYAKHCIEKGNIEEGVMLLNSVAYHADASDILDKYKYTVKGNIVKFGTYEQDNDKSNGSEAIEWIVLEHDAENSRSLLVSRYAIECIPYRDDYGAVTWENSDVRAWLNNKFIDSAFHGAEIGKIIESDIETPANVTYGTEGGNITADKLFLLSDEEFQRYLANTENAIGYTTPYSLDRGVLSGPISGTSVCWLRTPGESLVYVSTVSYVGELNSAGVYSYSASCGVRPAMWISTAE